MSVKPPEAETNDAYWSCDNSNNDSQISPFSCIPPRSAPVLTPEIISRVNGAIPSPNFPIREFMGTTWLEDVNVDFYMRLIKIRNSINPNLPKLYVFPSLFYQMLTQRGAGLQFVKETTGTDNIFDYDLIFIPCCISVHWRLVVVDLKVKSLLMYDSLAKPTYDNITCLKKVAVYLTNELSKLIKQESAAQPAADESAQKMADQRMPKQVREYFDSSKWTVKIVELSDIPRQYNYNDCGVFVLQYAEYLARRMNFDFTQVNMSYFRIKMIYEILDGSILENTHI